MRITSISPEFFGKFKSKNTFDIPHYPLVVFYGKNEVGKSTLVDFVMTLLSNKYSTSVMERHGEVGSILQGSIALEEGKQKLVLSFDGATIPRTKVKVKKKPSSKDSQLWKVIENLDDEEINNLYRLDAIEIRDLSITTKKIANYLKGERGGVSVQGTIDQLKKRQIDLREEINSGRADSIKSRRTDASSRLNKANLGASTYSKWKSEISSNEETVKKVEERISNADEKISLHTFIQGAKLILTAGSLAESELKDLESNLQLIDPRYEGIAELVSSKISLLQELLDADVDNELQKIRIEQDAQQNKLENLIQQLQTSEESINQNLILHNKIGIQRHFNKIRTCAASIQTIETVIGQINLSEKQSELAILGLRRQSAEEVWKKYEPRLSAHEWSVQQISSSQEKPKEVGLDKAINSTLINIFGILIVSSVILNIAIRQPIGAAISIALAISWLKLKLSNKTKARNDRSELPKEVKETDSRKIYEACQNLIATTEIEAAKKLELKIEQNRFDDASQQVTNAYQELANLFSEVCIGLNPTTDVDTLSDLLRKVEDTVTIRSENMDRFEKIAEFEENSSRNKGKTNEIIATLKTNLGPIAEIFETFEFGDLGGAILFLTNFNGRFFAQKELRAEVTAADKLMTAQKYAKIEIDKALIKGDSELDQTIKDQQAEKKDLMNKRDGFRAKITEYQTEIGRITEKSDIAEIKSILKSLRREESLKNIHIKRLNLLEEKIKLYSRNRNEALKPEAIQTLQKLVKEVALEWSSLDYDDQRERMTIKYKNGSEVDANLLSAGAKSLLQIAMRFIILIQESKENRPNLPLLCDDPLLHLDDIRTTEAFKMLKECAQGHQVLYFTCKNEICELAEKFAVPVIKLP